jgi:hypothetical protein
VRSFSARVFHSGSEQPSDTSIQIELNEHTTAQLVAFGSTMVDLMFISWVHAVAQDVAARARVSLVDALLEENKDLLRRYISESEEVDVRRLPKTTGMLAGMYAKRTVQKIREELDGLNVWRRARGLKQRLHERRVWKRNVAANDFAEELPEAIDPKIHAALRELESNDLLKNQT